VPATVGNNRTRRSNTAGVHHVTAIEQIKQQHEARLKAATDYELVVDALAKGESPPADVLAILSAAGRTADELAEDVRLTAERKQLEPVAACSKPAGKSRCGLDSPPLV
jgi:hypothetical protein